MLFLLRDTLIAKQEKRFIENREETWVEVLQKALQEKSSGFY
jgi:hypothetical protein